MPTGGDLYDAYLRPLRRHAGNARRHRNQGHASRRSRARASARSSPVAARIGRSRCVENGDAAAGSGARDHRRIRHVAQSKSDGRVRLPGGWRSRDVRIHRLWHSRRARSRSRALCRQARARGRRRAFGGERAARSGAARGNQQPDGTDLGGARRKSHAHLRRRRGRPAARARQARQRSQGAFGCRPTEAGHRTSPPNASATPTARSSFPAGGNASRSLARSTASWSPPASGRTST